MHDDPSENEETFNEEVPAEAEHDPSAITISEIIRGLSGLKSLIANSQSFHTDEPDDIHHYDAAVLQSAVDILEFLRDEGIAGIDELKDECEINIQSPEEQKESESKNE